MNWWVILILGIWLLGAITAIWTNDSDALGYSLIATIVIGIGYFFIKLMEIEMELAL